MNKEVKDLWLEALRSGRYTQGINRLRNFSDEFCCLGVLCDVYFINTGNGEWRGWEERYYKFLEHSSVLPVEVSEWAGLESGNGAFGTDAYETLASLNDIEKLSFTELADFIEDNF